MTEDKVLAFARDAIRSVWTLELLLLMQRDPARKWPVAELVAALRANTGLVTEGLVVLGAAGLVAADESGLHRYNPASAVLGDRVAALVELYACKPVTVVKTILSAPNARIRNFADAFRFRGRE